MIDAVLSYHMNSFTCGVSKFNHRLARELGVPIASVDNETYSYPLVSVKFWEGVGPRYRKKPYALFAHDRPWTPADKEFVARASQVYAANSAIAALLKSHVDVIEAWCPSTIEGNAHRGTINVLTFGMAHKIQTARYEKLKTLLDATGEDYTVSVSTAIHEGSPWDETSLVAERLRTIFGERLRVLGYLADDALARELRECTVVALFFRPALRANNTTFWTCMDAGIPIITNIDAHSPQYVLAAAANLDDLSHWPSHMKGSGIRDDRAKSQSKPFGWPALLDKMQGQPCAK